MSNKWKVFGVMLVAIVLAAIGEALVSKGMKRVEASQSGVGAQVTAGLHNGHILLGTFLMIGYVGLYVFALGLTELSFALPLSAASYLIGAFLSKFYVGEDVKPVRWIGTGVIIIGVLIVAIWGGNDSGGQTQGQQNGQGQDQQSKASSS